MAQSMISTKQLEYLKQREHEFAKIKLEEDAEIKEALIEQYRKSLGDILNTINAWIGKYAEKNGITLEEARKKISSIDMKEFQEKAKKYVEDKDFSKEAKAEMRIYNLNMRISRQELLSQEIRLQLRDLGLKEHQIMGSHLEKVARAELERRAGILGLNLRDKADIERILPKIVNGSHLGAPFSDRIWQNKREVASKLVDGLERSLLRGERPDVWARNYRKMVKDTVNNSRYAAERLAYTEASIIQEEVNTEAHVKAGFDSQVIITELGACDVCKPHDGKIVKIKDRRMGDNVPCWHPNCRCTTSSYYDDSKFEKMLEEYEKSSKIAKEHIKRMQGVEPKITNDLESVVAKNKGKLVGLEYKLKPVDSLSRKIREDAKEKNITLVQSDSEIYDVLRYTAVFEEDIFTNCVQLSVKLLLDE